MKLSAEKFAAHFIFGKFPRGIQPFRQTGKTGTHLQNDVFEDEVVVVVSRGELDVFDDELVQHDVVLDDGLLETVEVLHVLGGHLGPQYLGPQLAPQAVRRTALQELLREGRVVRLNDLRKSPKLGTLTVSRFRNTSDYFFAEIVAFSFQSDCGVVERGRHRV